MACIIEIRVYRSELAEAIQELLASGRNICGVRGASEVTIHKHVISIRHQPAIEPPLRRRIC
jgi:hypothetical protein